MWLQKSFVALAGIRRVKGSSFFFNDCHGKNMFSNSSLLCNSDEFLSMALNFNVYSSFAQKVLGPGQRSIIMVDMQIAN